MNSAVYIGKIRHRRFLPKPHAFNYPIFMMHLDLDEIESLLKPLLFWSTKRPALARFVRDDYHGPADKDLKTAVLDTVEDRIDYRPDGRVELLTHLRYLGYGFNPVSFYYCYNAENTLTAIMAEITNTPWKERHAYVLDCREMQKTRKAMRFEFDKAFHVSPFMPMDMYYDWVFTNPGESLTVHMINYKDDLKQFDATLSMQRKPATAAVMNGVLIKYPLMTIGVVAGIYFNAFLLKLKGIPFFRNPLTSTEDTTDSEQAGTTRATPLGRIH